MNPLAHLLEEIENRNAWQETIILNRNEFLHQAGKVNTNLYFVFSGSLRVFINDDGQEHTIRFGYENSFFGALDSFISNEPSVYSIQALRKAELSVISKVAFMDMIHASEKNLQQWHQVLSQLVYSQMERELDLLTSSPEQRYERVLKRSPQLFQEVPHKYIASYLRMTPETLSRIKKS